MLYMSVMLMSRAFVCPVNLSSQFKKIRCAAIFVPALLARQKHVRDVVCKVSFARRDEALWPHDPVHVYDVELPDGQIVVPSSHQEEGVQVGNHCCVREFVVVGIHGALGPRLSVHVEDLSEVLDSKRRELDL